MRQSEASAFATKGLEAPFKHPLLVLRRDEVDRSSDTRGQRFRCNIGDEARFIAAINEGVELLGAFAHGFTPRLTESLQDKGRRP